MTQEKPIPPEIEEAAKNDWFAFVVEEIGGEYNSSTGIYKIHLTELVKQISNAYKRGALSDAAREYWQRQEIITLRDYLQENYLFAAKAEFERGVREGFEAARSKIRSGCGIGMHEEYQTPDEFLASLGKK